MPEFRLQSPLAAVQDGQNWIDGLFAQRAQREAGAALSQGDYGTAANTLFRSGNLDAGQGVRNQQRTNTVNQRTDDAAQRAQSLQTTLSAARALRSTRDAGGDVAAELARLRPTFIAMGTDPGELQQIEGAIAQNPAFIDDVENIVGQQLRELQFINLGEGNAIAVDEGTGETVQTYSAPRRPQRVAVGNDYIEVGEDGEVRPLYQGARPPEYRSVRNSDGTETIVELGGRPGGVMAGGGGGGGGSGEGFSDRAEVLDFIAPIVGDFRPTSGARSREEQDSLIARGATSAYNSAHVGGLGQDIVPSAPREQWDQIAEQLRATGRFGRVLVESGSGRNQGTGAHIHLEPRTGGGGGTQAPAASNGARVVAQGQERGMSPAEANAERRATRQDRGDARQLRRDFEGLEDVQAYRTVESAYRQVDSLSRNTGNAADDIALTFSYMKMLDPGSVVREGEYALVGRAQGLTGQALVALQRIDSGQSLTPQLRQALRESAGRVLQSRRQRYDQVVNQYRGYAEEDGFDPNRVVPVTASPTSAPSTGQRGLRFTPTEAQTRLSQQIVSGRRGAEPPRASRGNPVIINPADPTSSFANVPRGGFFITPDGQLRGPKP